VRVEFLGTGTSQGVPVIGSDHPVCLSDDPKDKRLRSSVLIEDGTKTFVIDTGPDFRQQMLRSKTTKLDGILFTHEHKDHIAGFDDIRPFYFNQGALDVYCDERVKASIRKSFDYMFQDFRYPGVPEVNMHNIEKDSFEAAGVRFTPLPVLHYKLPVLGFRTGGFSYITDANHIPDETLELLNGTEVLVLNALRKEDHISHFNLQQAIEMAQKIGAKRTYFTHISHLLGFHQEVEVELPEGVYLAYDGLSINL
jgi:phosphoribosyl 1,2-cyclic phosphate phosphodiesterase